MLSREDVVDRDGAKRERLSFDYSAAEIFSLFPKAESKKLRRVLKKIATISQLCILLMQSLQLAGSWHVPPHVKVSKR